MVTGLSGVQFSVIQEKKIFTSVSKQNRPNIGGNYRATSNFLQINFVTLSDYVRLCK